jgi:hypothetical protein
MRLRGSLEFARRTARQVAGAALSEAIEALSGLPDSLDKGFLMEMPLYVVERDK